MEVDQGIQLKRRRSLVWQDEDQISSRLMDSQSVLECVAQLLLKFVLISTWIRGENLKLDSLA